MKKIIAFLIVVTMILTVFVGCKKDGTDDNSYTEGESDAPFIIPEGLSGTDVIKLLLASQRLNSQLLKKEGNLFENGSTVMRTLAERATANLQVSLLADTSEAPRGGKLTVDGDLFSWSDFAENCNSYDYFENITQNIVLSANQGAELIDNTKKYVRVVDKWVAIGQTQYYLSVGEDHEIIYSRDGGFMRICKRYKNENGENVYEMYFSSEQVESRMLYVPGIRYEWSEKTNENEGTYFVADNSKGYWETLVVGKTPDHYNLSCFVMKNDICYDAFYDTELEEVTLLKTMSSDRKTDILFFADYEEMSMITLNLGAFNGIKNVEIVASPDKVVSSLDQSTSETTVIYNSTGEIYATTTGIESAVLNLENDKKIEYGAQYAGGGITAGRVMVMYGSGIYTGSLDLTVYGSTYEERFANLSAFLEETGLECRRDINTVLSGIDRAYTELDSIIKYYRWNSYPISRSENITASLLVEDALLEAFVKSYQAVENEEVIDFSDKEALELKISFSPISITSLGSASFENTSAEIVGLVMNVSDTTLFVENESYTISFALVKEGSDDVIHIPTVSPTETVYTKGESFTLGTAHARLDIPTLAEGKYTLVAYASTSDKIRASQYVPIAFTSVSTEAISLSGAVLTPEHKESGELVLSFSHSSDVKVALTNGVVLSYSDLVATLSECAGAHGVISDGTLEIYDSESDSFIPYTDTESSLANGTYRIAYNVANGTNETFGYVYAEYASQK